MGKNILMLCARKALVWETGVQGVQVHPQKFWFIENLGKIPENPDKIPYYLGKILENLSKNGAQRCLTSNMAPNACRKTSKDHIFGGHTRPVTSLEHQEGRRVFWEGPKNFELCPIVLDYVQHILSMGGDKFSRGASTPWLRAWVTPKNSRQNLHDNVLGKFGQKSFAPPKICLLLHLWRKVETHLEIWDQALISEYCFI